MLKALFRKFSPPQPAATGISKNRRALEAMSQLTPDRVGQFQVFSRSDRDELMLLADKLEPRSISAGETLFRAGEASQVDYLLLEGNLRLSGECGETRELMAGTERASRLVSGAQPHDYTALAVTDCVYLTLDRESMGELMAGDLDGANGREAPEYAYLSSEESARLMESFHADLAANRFTLSSIPEVALNIRRVVDDPAVTADRVADVIGTDPAIAAKVTRAANSVLYRGLEPCDTLRDAVVRLGVGTTRHLVFSFALRDLYDTRVPALLSILRESWDHAIYVAAIASVLARQYRRFSPEEGMLAGLMSNIGVLSLVNYLANYPELHGDPERCRAIIDELKGEVGGLVLRHWSFPEDTIRCALNCDGWGYAGADTGQADLCDLVITSAYHAHIGQRALPRIDLVPACQRLLGSDLDPESALRFMASAREEIAEARALIG